MRKRGVLAWWCLFTMGCTVVAGIDHEYVFESGPEHHVGTGGGSSLDSRCIPSLNPNGAVGDDCGIFVELGGDDAGGDGTKESPVKTLAKAAELAKSGQNIYACGQVFPEALELPAGVSLFGGLDCMGDWKPGSTRTSISPMADMVALKVGKGSSVVRVEDVDARAADATVAGGSSIAVIVDGATVDFARCDFLAGNGVAGEKGATPMDDVGSYNANDPSIVGANGVAACTAAETPNVGGAGKTNDLCNASVGGNGGEGNAASGSAGTNGAPLPEPNPDGWGLGGVGAMVGSCKRGEDGLLGADGASGAGAGASELGLISIEGFTGAAGHDGAKGAAGQGGGGGGGAKGKAGCAGASGGGGGAGGCGGNGGLGGKAGGASIALISLSATLSFEEVMLSAGSGAPGGEGGDGQNGGVGGNGGTGGNQAAGTLSGCPGGNGGVGGFGGKGGGGRGGHSLGIAFTGTAPPQPTKITVGMAGMGGLGADMTMNGALGEAKNTLEFPAAAP